MTNENVLEGIACPKCNSEGPFDINCYATFLNVTDDGCSEFEGMDWGEESDITCKACGHVGIIEDFRVDEDEDYMDNGVTIEMTSAKDLFK